MPRRSSSDGQRRSFRQEHGPGDFYYSELPDFRPHPVMRCICGAVPEAVVNSWEEAGKWLDGHIADALRKDDLKYHEFIREQEAFRKGDSTAGGSSRRASAGATR